jgi:hypothetical protein
MAQNYINYYNPSSVMSVPNEEVVVNGYVDTNDTTSAGISGNYIQFVDDTLEANQTSYSGNYYIQCRMWQGDVDSFYSNGPVNTPITLLKNEYVSPYTPTGLYFNSAVVTPSQFTFGDNNVVTIPNANSYLFNGVTSDTVVAGDKRLQWRWGRQSTPSITFTLSTTNVYMASVTNFAECQNYQLVCAVLGTDYYFGYLAKLDSTNIALYKYIDGAINLAVINADNCITLTGCTAMYGVNFSNWINFKYYDATSSTQYFLKNNGSNITSKTGTFTFTLSSANSNPPVAQYYYVTVYDENKVELFTSDIQYDSNLSVTVNGFSLSATAYYVIMYAFVDGIIISSAMERVATSYLPTTSTDFGITASYTSCNNYITINFSGVTTAYADGHIYIQDTTDTTMLDDLFMTGFSISNGGINCYTVKNGHTYNIMATVATTTNILYQNLGTFTIQFEGFFISDVANNVSYQLINVLSSGDTKLNNQIYDYNQNLKYLASSVGQNKYMSGSLSGELVTDNSIDSVQYKNDFFDLCCSNRSIILQDMKGNAYYVFITEPNVAPISNFISDQPVLVSLNWNEVGTI